MIEAGSAAILNATTSFDNATSEWVIDYTFTDGADHIHIIHAATGY